MKRKNSLFTNIFIIVLIIFFVYVIPLTLVNSYDKIYTNAKGTMLSNAYDNLLDSDIEYKNSVIIIKKSTENSLSKMQAGYSVLFTYYTVCTGLLSLIAGIYLKKHNTNLSKICIITSIVLFICALIYIII